MKNKNTRSISKKELDMARDAVLASMPYEMVQRIAKLLQQKSRSLFFCDKNISDTLWRKII